jgi:hypothetical protein
MKLEKQFITEARHAGSVTYGLSRFFVAPATCRAASLSTILLIQISKNYRQPV